MFQVPGMVCHVFPQDTTKTRLRDRNDFSVVAFYYLVRLFHIDLASIRTCRACSIQIGE